MTDKNFPAFPRQHDKDGHNGMTLRDYFAAKAMAAFLLCGLPSQKQADKFTGFTVAEYVSTKAYEMADEMLKAREV